MSNLASPLRLLLGELETAMKEQGLWAEQAPSHEALSSTQPFCLDTLAFEQWLQFILIPQFNAMLDNPMALPSSCCILPMATEVFKGRSLLDVLSLLKKIDALFTASA